MHSLVYQKHTHEAGTYIVASKIRVMYLLMCCCRSLQARPSVSTRYFIMKLAVSSCCVEISSFLFLFLFLCKCVGRLQLAATNSYSTCLVLLGKVKGSLISSWQYEHNFFLDELHNLCVFIDIEEKYKATVLKSHRHET
jgi:hypothetical protein